MLAMLGTPLQMLVICVVILLLFGNRLPGVMRSLGQSVIEFKKGVQGVDDDQVADEQRERDRKLERP